MVSEKIAAPEKFVASAQPDAFFEKPQQIFSVLVLIPFDPVGLAVLTPGVIITALGPAQFVTCAEHRYPLADQQKCRIAFHPPAPQTLYFKVSGGALEAAVPAQVVSLSIPILFAIFQIVFVIVTDQVVEGEAVMAGDEIDRVQRSPTTVLVEVRAAGDSGG